jgi:hypothetical protein
MAPEPFVFPVQNRPGPVGRFYHVAPESYREEEDLCSYNELARRGRDPGPWKWPKEVPGDPDLVSLFRTLADARSYQQTYGGIIYEVRLPPDYERQHVRPNSEGFPSVRHRIPGWHVRRPE